MKIFGISSFLVIALTLGACRNKNEETGPKKKENTAFFEKAPEEVPELSRNRLSNEPSDFLRLHANSEINWQPWTKEVLDLAERSQRLIFVFVGATKHPESHKFAKLLEDKFKTEINEQYVAVMADSEIDPALTLACHLLATERREAIAFPYILWLSHEGNPVAWIPVTNSDEESLLLGFRRAQNTVQSIRKKSPRYVVENSRYDNEGRLARIAAVWNLNEEGKSLRPEQGDLFLRTQGLSDLYDHLDKTFDDTGGIPPGNLITALARISQHPASPPRLKKNASIASRDSIKLLAQSAIRDPLDGYFFSRRASRSFSIPALSKNIETQAEMLSAIASSPKTPASERALEQLLTSLAEKPLQNQALIPDETSEMAFIWSSDSLSKILTPEEFKVAKSAFNIKGLGNVPNGDDPRRLYFRRNTLGLAKFGTELSKDTEIPQDEAEKLLSSAVEKIAARRAEILTTSEALHEESMVTLSSQARLVTALARAQADRPAPKTEELLEKLGNEILDNFFTPEGKLLRILSKEGTRQVSAQGYDYTVTIEALLEWYRVTWKPELLQKTQDLATTYLANFLGESSRPIEVALEDHPLTFPVYSHSMIFGPSTWGTGYGVFRKLTTLQFEDENLAPTLAEITPNLEVGLKNAPVIHTDYLLAAANSVENYLLVISNKEQGNQALRRQLAKAKFDSVVAVVENTTFPNLPSPKENAAILLKDGKQVASYQTANLIVGALQEELAQ